MSKLIYLDQNKWIDIARAFYKREDGKKFETILKELQDKVNKNEVILPISVLHVFETAKNENKDRRQRLANFISQLSKAYGILPYISVREQEVYNAILKRLGRPAVHDIKTLAIDKGMAHVLGVELPKLSVSPKFERALVELNQLETVIAKMMVDMIDKKVIEEQNNEDVEVLADYEKSRQLKNEELTKEMRLRVAIAEMSNNILPIVVQKLKDLSINAKDFVDNFKGVEDWKDFFFSMPTMDIWINLHVLRDNDKGKAIHKNDTKDMAFLSIAVPYCDIVVTEKYWAHLLKTNGYDKKYNTTILTDLTELPNYLT